MIPFQDTVSLWTDYDLHRIAPPEDMVFFDIETTGFSPLSSSLYLIGSLSFENGIWTLNQWFADSMSSEQALLEHFFALLESKKIFVHFNGDSFDIPYLRKCAAQYSILTPFEGLKSFDIYKKIRSLKAPLGLSSLKQKSTEQFLHIEREDPFHGGELIPVYQAYLKTGSKELLHSLLLHNREDVLQMPRLLSMLSYLDIPQEDFRLLKHQINETMLIAAIKTAACFPQPISYHSDTGALEGDPSQLTLHIPVCSQELKYYYPDYKNYYYLPAEDSAIHKKVAQFVDKRYRTAATRSTCYIRRNDRYLPNPDPKQFPAFSAAYRSKKLYTPYQEDEEFLCRYIQAFLRGIF